MILGKLFQDSRLSGLVSRSWNNHLVLPEYLAIETDTRCFQATKAFIAIKGENHDSFKFTKNILKDIPIVVFQKSEENEILANEWSKEHPQTLFLETVDVIRYLQMLAMLHVENWYLNSEKHFLIAISGSNGKTTTKEMLSHILKTTLKEKVVFTKKNNNNHIGVPLTLFDIDPRVTEIAVVEFGSNHPGEMNVLCELALPNVGITTNIGHTHMEFFPSLKAVFEEEGLIFHAVMKNTHNHGLFLINDDDEFLKTFPNYSHTKRFSCLNKNVDYFYKMSGLNAMEVFTKDGKVSVVMNKNITGEHNFINLCNAYTLALILYPEKANEFKINVQTFMPTLNRSQWMKYKKTEVFLDAYNANPSSMEAALKSFIFYCEQLKLNKDEVLLVVGEMKELGEQSSKYHRDFGRFVNSLKMPKVIYVGGFAEEFQSECNNAILANNVENAKESFLRLIEKSKKCFIKASRSLQLERLVDITKG